MRPKNSAYYEIKFWLSNITPRSIFFSCFIIFSSVVVGLGDAQSFFTGDSSPVPESWTFLKNKRNARIIATCFIVLPGIAVLISDGLEKKKQVEELSRITKDFTFPYLETKLNEFCEDLKKTFGLSDEVRLYIAIPVRKGFINWKIQIVCRSKNVIDRELYASFEFGEGAYGYAFNTIDKNKQHRTLPIRLMPPSEIPSSYKHLSDNNKSFVKSDLIGFLITPSFEKDFLNGVLIIDTSDSSDMSKLIQPRLQSHVLDWLGVDIQVITLLWRMTTYGNW
jgi:hypothetical protein